MKLYNFDFSKKIFFHPENIVAYKQGRRPFPILLEVDLTNRCNHRCCFCFYSEHLQSSSVCLESGLIVSRLAEARQLGAKAVSFTGGGEPMLHKDFVDILRSTKAEGFDVGLVTNGSLISDRNAEALVSCLQWIRISVGGGDRESYKTVQGVDHFEKVIGNIEMLSKSNAESGGLLNIGVRMLVTPENVDSVVNLARLLRGTSINYVQLAPDQFTEDGGEFWDGSACMKAFAEAEELLSGTDVRLLTSGYVWLQDRLDYPRTCYAHCFQNVIQAEGNVVFCKNARGNEKYYVGNIYESSLREIWEGDVVRGVESRVRPNNCGLYCKNMALNISMEEVLYPTRDMSPNFVG